MSSQTQRRAKALAISIPTWFVLSLGGSGCAGTQVAPSWLKGDLPPEYAKSRYVTAIGAGDSLEAAVITAKSELSRIFSAQLESEIQLIEEQRTRGDRSSSQSDLLVDTKIRTDVVLQGAEVGLHWRDPKTGQTWALAVLERRKECLRIRAEGRDLNTRLDAFATESRSRSNPLLAVRVAVQATKIAVELDGLQARSRVLGNQWIAGRTVSTGQMRAEVDARMNSLTFVVSAQDIDGKTGRARGSLPQLRERIAGNLTQLGFQVGPSAGANVIPIAARLRLSRVARNTEWIEYRWEGSAEVGSPIAGDPAVIAAESEGAESHPEDSTARLRARRKGEQDLARRLDTLLKAFLGEGAEG
ncbi:MAG: LPP20 family lipoprotein [Myxococcota bacterium]